MLLEDCEFVNIVGGRSGISEGDISATGYCEVTLLLRLASVSDILQP